MPPGLRLLSARRNAGRLCRMSTEFTSAFVGSAANCQPVQDSLRAVFGQLDHHDPKRFGRPSKNGGNFLQLLFRGKHDSIQGLAVRDLVKLPACPGSAARNVLTPCASRCAKNLPPARARPAQAARELELYQHLCLCERLVRQTVHLVHGLAQRRPPAAGCPFASFACRLMVDAFVGAYSHQECSLRRRLSDHLGDHRHQLGRESFQ